MVESLAEQQKCSHPQREDPNSHTGGMAPEPVQSFENPAGQSAFRNEEHVLNPGQT